MLVLLFPIHDVLVEEQMPHNGMNELGLSCGSGISPNGAVRSDTYYVQLKRKKNGIKSPKIGRKSVFR